MNRKLECVVVGTGRCGTTYMAQLLTSAGIPCGHESIFTPEDDFKKIKNKLKNLDNVDLKLSECSLMSEKPWIGTNSIVADSSYLAAPFLKYGFFKTVKIIHVVRHPLDVISSFVLDGLYFEHFVPEKSVPYQDFIKKNMSRVYYNDLDAVNRAAIYYIYWNKLIERSIRWPENYFLHKVESSPKKLIKFLNKKNYDKNLSKNINTWKKESNRKRVSIKNINKSVLKELKEMSLRYSYHLCRM
jgi:hypothetical protein